MTHFGRRDAQGHSEGAQSCEGRLPEGHKDSWSGSSCESCDDCDAWITWIKEPLLLNFVNDLEIETVKNLWTYQFHDVSCSFTRCVCVSGCKMFQTLAKWSKVHLFFGKINFKVGQ